ncbi:MAG: TrkH family potassium uptake protein [Erysipelotrichaceae bacterium]|nr:TrkH family potassium uptake protein [Erysipelotrichaceae bacterium]
MNRRMILYTLGKMLEIEGILMVLPLLTGIIYHESTAIYYLITALICTGIGFLISHKQPKKKNIYAKEGFLICALAWILLSIFGAIPLWISGEIPHYIDALFEIVSGFTTTGSSILNEIETLSRCNLFWRSFSHWIGGMGILVFVVAFLPDVSGSTMHILKAEMPGPIVGKMVSKVKMNAQLLYKIYAFLTTAEVILLVLGGMPFFDSLLNAFATAGTGGFAIKNASIAAYDSAYVDGVITVFMILFGVNFNLYYFVVIGKVTQLFRSEELRCYLAIIAGAAIMITINIAHLYSSIFEAFRYAIFMVGSIITTTGFVTADYGQWPMFSQIILILLMFIGACAGSTGGGMKVSRIMIYAKTCVSEFKRMIHPHSVVSVEFEGSHISDSSLRNVFVYLAVYFFILFTSILLISLNNFDFATTFSSVVTCMNNIGPGLNICGPVGNFSTFSDFSKLVLCFDMLAGRLELFPLLMLFSKSLWKK